MSTGTSSGTFSTSVKKPSPDCHFRANFQSPLKRPDRHPRPVRAEVVSSTIEACHALEVFPPELPVANPRDEPGAGRSGRGRAEIGDPGNPEARLYVPQRGGVPQPDDRQSDDPKKPRPPAVAAVHGVRRG